MTTVDARLRRGRFHAVARAERVEQQDEADVFVKNRVVETFSPGGGSAGRSVTRVPGEFFRLPRPVRELGRTDVPGPKSLTVKVNGKPVDQADARAASDGIEPDRYVMWMQPLRKNSLCATAGDAEGCVELGRQETLALALQNAQFTALREPFYEQCRKQRSVSHCEWSAVLYAYGTQPDPDMAKRAFLAVCALSQAGTGCEEAEQLGAREEVTRLRRARETIAERERAAAEQERKVQAEQAAAQAERERLAEVEEQRRREAERIEAAKSRAETQRQIMDAVKAVGDQIQRTTEELNAQNRRLRGY